MRAKGPVAEKPAAKKHVQYHKDGTVWAKGQTVAGVATGYWEWFRKDGTRMRSGHFAAGRQVGQWTTYDRKGRVYKVTTIKPKLAARSKGTGSSIDDYLAALPDDKRIALQRLRKAIRAAAPTAQECISYQLPAFRLDGKFLVAFGAAASHCAFYPGGVVEAHKDVLEGYDISKGTIRFRPDRALPATLVRRLVKARMAAIAAGRPDAKAGGAARRSATGRPRTARRGTRGPPRRSAPRRNGCAPAPRA